jgi:hypothetical protein
MGDEITFWAKLDWGLHGDKKKKQKENSSFIFTSL